MENYVVSFLTFAVYLFIENKLKTKIRSVNKYYITVAAVSLAGLVLVNYFDFRLFEYFFLVTFVSSLLELYQGRKRL